MAPVGLAWQKALAGSKPATLHVSDKSHPNEQGSYLAACVFYGTLLNAKIENLPGRLVLDGKVLTSIATADANRLQRLAREAVKDEKAKSAPQEVP